MEATTSFNHSSWIGICKEYLTVKNAPSLYAGEGVRHYFVLSNDTFYLTKNKTNTDRIFLSKVIEISRSCLNANISVEDLTTIQNVLLDLKKIKEEKEDSKNKKIQLLESVIEEFKQAKLPIYRDRNTILRIFKEIFVEESTAQDEKDCRQKITPSSQINIRWVPSSTKLEEGADSKYIDFSEVN
jgi:hypothetical protein